MDQIHYSMLNSLPTKNKYMLKDLFNDIWLEGTIPMQWKRSIITLIHKNGKPPNTSFSFRPIALMSCVQKTYERIIKNRLQWWLEHNDKLPSNQHGFRKGRSVIHAQAQLILDINLAFSDSYFILSLFLDIQGAYDNVDLSILGFKLVQIGLPGLFVHNIMSLITNRETFVHINGDLIGPKTTFKGLPKGGILSPILYSIYAADLVSVLPNTVKIIQYADDICIYTIGENLENCKAQLSDGITPLLKWFYENGLSISIIKTVLCPFMRKDKSDWTYGGHWDNFFSNG